MHRDEGGDVGDLIHRIAGEERLLERGDIRPVAGVGLRLEVTVHMEIIEQRFEYGKRG